MAIPSDIRFGCSCQHIWQELRAPEAGVFVTAHICIRCHKIESAGAAPPKNNGVTQYIGWPEISAIILKHAPVIDAEKIAKRLDDRYVLKNRTAYLNAMPTNYAKRIEEAAQLITDNMTLDIIWKDGKAEWGIFTLIAGHYPNSYNWFFEISVVYLNKRQDIARDASFEDIELAQQACKTALKKILAGVKE